MRVQIHPIKSIQCWKFEFLTYEEFLEHRCGDNSLGWLDGYLIHYTHFEAETFDKAVQKGDWIYRSIIVAPMPEFQREIKMPDGANTLVLKQRGSLVGEEVIKWVKETQDPALIKTNKCVKALDNDRLAH